MQRKTGQSDLWNAIRKEEKARLEHTIRLDTCKTIHLNLSLFTGIFYVLSPCTVYIKLLNFILFSLENDDMESSKRCVKLLNLILFEYLKHRVVFITVLIQSMKLSKTCFKTCLKGTSTPIKESL